MIQTLLDSGSGPTGGNGGTIEFPSVGTFQFSGPPIVIGTDLGGHTQPYAIIVQGDGQGSEAIPVLQKTDGGDLFQINNGISGDDHVGGVTFRDLQINYSTVQTSGAAIHAVNGENVRLFRVVLTNCPTGVWFDQSSQGSMIGCTGLYFPIMGTAVVGTCVMIGNSANNNSGTDTYIAGCVFRNSSNTGMGMQIYGAQHVRLANTRIEGFQQGILVTPGATGSFAQRIHMENVDCFTTSTTTSAGAGFLVKPGAGITVWDVCLVNCRTAPGTTTQTAYTGSGFVIDTSAGSGALVDNVRLVSCFAAGWIGPGLEIIAGSGTVENVQVNGGAYICNGQGGTTGRLGSGIYVNGAANGVYIDDAQLDNISSQYSATQSYGIAFDSGASHVRVRGCSMINNNSAPVYSNAPGVHCFVINCRGYNDTLTHVAVLANLPATGVQFDGTTVMPTAPYFGPILVTWSGGTVSNSKISHDRNSLLAVPTGVTSGAFPLGVGQSLELDYSVSPTAFNVFGQ
jgi:hypothetical protein